VAEHLLAVNAPELLAATGLEASDVEEVAGLLADRRRIIICWAMGITQHRQAVATIREMVNTLLLRGAIGRPGAGVCPVRGHSNVQGDRTMGIYEKPSAAFLDALRRVRLRAAVASTATTSWTRSRPWPGARSTCSWPWAATSWRPLPTPTATAAALARVPLTVQVSTKLNRSHLVAGQAALILPCLGRTEVDHTGGRTQRVTVEDSMSMVHASAGSLLEPASPTSAARWRSWPAWPSGSCPGGPIDWAGLAADYDAIRDHIEAVIPGFTDFNRRIDQPGGFVLPHPPRDQPRFPTTVGRAHLTVNHFDPARGGAGGPAAPADAALARPVQHHHLRPRRPLPRHPPGRRVVFVHPDDLAALGFGDGDVVDVVSEWRRRVRPAGRRLPARGLRRGPRHLRRLLPRGQRARAPRVGGRGEQHAHVQGGGGALRAPRSRRPGVPHLKAVGLLGSW
jgi:anaerobic selenocysteine-containing dehydrogenase